MREIKPAPAVDALVARGAARAQILERFQAVNVDLTKFILSTMEIEDQRLQREVIARTIAALSHQQNIVVGIAAAVGMPQAAVETAVKLGQQTSAASLAHAQTQGEAALEEKKG